LVNIALFVINVLVGGGLWFYWPLTGWGIGLGGHALAVFGFSGTVEVAAEHSLEVPVPIARCSRD
jgi:hypothetical protein